MYEFADGLFVQDSAVRFYGFRIQTRMAVVRLPRERLFVYSPVSLAESVREALDRLGAVACVVAPNKLHNLALSEYRAAYPAARFYAAPGLPERRPDLRFEAVLSNALETGWEHELDHVLTEGNAFFSEGLFFHSRSRTLLVCDLVENFDRDTASPLARAVARIFGVRERPMASPEFRLYTLDTAAAERSLDRARRWDFERIFLCHGRLIESDAKAVFQGVCGELLERVRRRSLASRWLLRRIARLQ
jgi:hypothetical protein